VAPSGFQTEPMTAQAVLDALLDGMGGVGHMDCNSC
jgi:hypothetical protein